ncbi:MAG: hypothetical protein OXI79_09555 [Gammaproteobacteria bacterium]|nr:hypothetical protein [Gammaproteobacteria bacterium]
MLPPKRDETLTWYEAWFHGMECLGGRRVGEDEWRGPCFQCGGADDLHLRGTDVRLRTDRVEVRKQTVVFHCTNGCWPEEAARTVFRRISAGHSRDSGSNQDR